jgi:hypothetical protein
VPASLSSGAGRRGYRRGMSQNGDPPQRPPLLTPRQEEFMLRAVPIDDHDPLQYGLGFQARLWAQVSLPYRNPGDVRSWERRNGAVTLVLQPGPQQAADGTVTYPFPYGVIPRLLLTWMATEAVRTKDRQLFLGPSLSKFLSEIGMGHATGGRLGSITRLREQIKRLAGTRMTVLDGRELAGHWHSKMESVQIATGWDLWLSPDEQQQVLWPSSITLSQEFYDSILAAPVPINMRHLAALRATRGSGLSIDIYTWLAWRMFNLKSSTLITWQRLAQQFGTDYARTRDFKAQFLKQLRPVTIVYPEAKVTVADNGLLLSPSPTPGRRFR